MWGKGREKYQVILQCPWCYPDHVFPAPAFLALPMHGEWDALRGLLKFWALWWWTGGWYSEDNQAHDEGGMLEHALIRELLSSQPPVHVHRQCCSQIKDFRVLCQLPLERSWFLQAQDICTVSLTTPVTEVASDPAAWPVGTFHLGAHQLVGCITKTSAVPIFTDPCAVHY